MTGHAGAGEADLDPGREDESCGLGDGPLSSCRPL